MTNRETIQTILLDRKQDLISRYHLKAIGIFGSCTRDDFREDSDVDILIEYENPMGMEFIDLADELERLLKRKVDLVSRNGIKPKYFEEIKKDLIYV
ncbi:MAG TPA: nucleotidyltransferase family protein [Bacteroidota bacterium]|nr:nucleotidyltransferase family protein [Bacteroidota bacterium]